MRPPNTKNQIRHLSGFAIKESTVLRNCKRRTRRRECQMHLLRNMSVRRSTTTTTTRRRIKPFYDAVADLRKSLFITVIIIYGNFFRALSDSSSSDHLVYSLTNPHLANNEASFVSYPLVRGCFCTPFQSTMTQQCHSWCVPSKRRTPSPSQSIYENFHRFPQFKHKTKTVMGSSADRVCFCVLVVFVDLHRPLMPANMSHAQRYRMN